MKTKQQELEILDAAIAALGPDTYLGPWLQEIRDEVYQYMRNDFFPEITTKGAAERAQQIIDEARESANGLMAVAQHEADKINARIDLRREELSSQLHSAIRGLNR